MKNQKGVSLTEVILIAVLLIVLALFGLKIIPVYIEYFGIKKNLVAVAKDESLKEAPPTEVRKAFDRRAIVENISAIKGADIEVNREGGILELKVSYSQKVPLVGDASMCFDFNLAVTGD